jgi:hypothetical protein
MVKKQIATMEKQLADKLQTMQTDYDHFSIHTKAKLKSIDKQFEDTEYKSGSRLTTLETHYQIMKENLDNFVHKMLKHVFDTQNIVNEHEKMYRKALKEVKAIR